MIKPNKLAMQIRGWRLVHTTWPYNLGRWPYYRAGLMLDGSFADIRRMGFLRIDFIHLPEGMKN